MPKLGLAKVADLPLYIEYVDFNGSGFIGRTFKCKAAAGQNACVVAGVGKYGEMLLRTDLIAFKGAEFDVTDLGPVRVRFISNGTAWKVKYPSVVSLLPLGALGAQSASEQVIGTMSIPAGLFNMSTWSIEVGVLKNGTTDSLIPGLRLGTAGTTADILIGSSGTLLAASNRSGGFRSTYEGASATSLGKHGLATLLGDFIGSGTSLAASALTVTNMLTTAQKLTITATMSGASDKPQLEYARLMLWPN